MFIYLLALSLPVSAGALLFARREYRRHGKLTPAGLLAVCLMLLVPNLMLDSVIGYAWPSTGLDWLGLALGTLGLALCLAGITAFHSPSKVLCLDAGRLTLSGPYRWSRNPQYVGCFLLLLGFALNDWSWWCLVALLVLAIDLHLLVLVEEEHLRRVFGEAYREFCRRVPRYAGWRTAS